jgi:ABC-type glycerol-3-phosphate transport system substrate-binding protein
LYATDYTESLENKGGANVWRFFKTLKDKGYIPNNSASLTDDDYALMWSKGQIAATAFFVPWTKPYFDSAIEQGLIKEPHRYSFVSFPNHAPACTNYSGIVVNKNTKHKEAVIEFIKQLTGVESANVRAEATGSIAYIQGVTAKPGDPHVAEINNIVSANGLYDLGVTNSWFAEVRGVGFPILQAVLSGKLSPEKAAEEYAKKVNEIIQ